MQTTGPKDTMQFTVHMMLLSIEDEIQRLARKYEMLLDRHVNPLAIQLLDNYKDITIQTF